jgi:hypothetical protein
MMPLPTIERGTLTLYRLYDVGQSIDLAQAAARLADTQITREALATVRQAGSIRIAQLPLRVELGAHPVQLGDFTFTGTVRAGVYDLGALAVLVSLPLTSSTPWDTVADLQAAAQGPPDALLAIFNHTLERMEQLLGPAINKPDRATIVEDYSVLIIEQLDRPYDGAALGEQPVVQAALLGERRVLSPNATSLLVGMSYYPDDLALLSWNGALLIDPDLHAAAAAAELLEFANVELLLLRSYDADLEGELPQLYRRVAAMQRRLAFPPVRRYRRLLNDVQRLVAEVTEVTERVDNAIKVTDDVYWNRLYSAVVNVLLVDVWRRGVDHKLSLLRETYAMLHDEADAERAAALEWAIILLIVFEIGMALLGR